MGRKLLRSFDGPPLCSGFTFASFHFSGKVLVLILKLHIYAKLSAMKGAASFRSLGPISSELVDFLTSGLFKDCKHNDCHTKYTG